MRNNYFSLGFLFLSLFSFNISQAQTYVNINVTGGLNDGSSWSNAYSELFVALQNANNGDQLWVAQGTYIPTLGTNRNIPFQLPQGVAIYGGFVGNETSLSQRDWANNITILSGDIGTTGISTDNSYIVVNVAQSTTDVTLDGFTIQHGYADGIFLKSGSGLFINSYATNTGSNPIIENCTFSKNYSADSGGAVYVEAGAGGLASPSFTNCIFEYNESGFSGGAVYNSGFSGGDVSSSFLKCIFRNNLAGESGGAIFNHGGFGGTANPSFKECNFESNASINGHGGGLYNQGSQNGGDASPFIINCRFYDNSGFAAGAMYNNGSNSGNSSPIVTNCTFYRNFTTGAGGTGGSIYSNGSHSGKSSAQITNCIIWGNNAPFGSQVMRSVEGSPTISFSLVDAADCTALQSGTNPNITCGAGMIYNINPLFTAASSGDLTLQTGSPALDVGNNSINSEIIDLSLSSRIQNGIIDLGAYEKAAALPVELISFRANIENDDVKISWITANEINNDHFLVQHSIDGTNYVDLDKIQGAGNSVVLNSYSYIHDTPENGNNYYRLKQIDFDGSFSFSNIEIVRVYNGTLGIYPNPVRDVLNISFDEFEVGEVEFAIFNIHGQEVHRQVVDIQDGLHIIELNKVGSFLPGNYFIKVINSKSGTYIQKFQKLRD